MEEAIAPGGLDGEVGLDRLTDLPRERVRRQVDRLGRRRDRGDELPLGVVERVRQHRQVRRDGATAKHRAPGIGVEGGLWLPRRVRLDLDQLAIRQELPWLLDGPAIWRV